MPKTKKSSINSLIPINTQKVEHENVQMVNARDVWEFLEIKRDFSNWIKDKIKNYNFIEGQDFLCSPNLASKEDKNEIISDSETKVGGHNIKEYYVTLSMGKQLTMVQNNLKGSEARKYFIQCEDNLKTLTFRLARQAERKAQLEYQQARAEGKITRKEETDVIKKFVEYAYAQGSKNAKKYFISITNMENKALFYFEQALDKPNNLRELLDRMQLTQLAVADNLVNRTLIECMAKGMFYKEIYIVVRERVETYATCIGGKTPILITISAIENKQQLSIASSANN